MSPAHASRDDLRAALGARQALGPEYEAEVVDGFLDRVEQGLDARVAAQVEQRLGQQGVAQRARPVDAERDDRGFVLGLVSLGTGIPITAIAGGTSGVWGILVAWAGIAAVNTASAWGRQR